MHRFPGLWLALLSFLTASFSSALSDPKLVSLVPPGAQVVAGIDGSMQKGQQTGFVLVSHNNTVDLEDFFALVGVDSSRIIRYAVFVAMDDESTSLARHSLLISGHFDQPRIYQSAVQGGAEASRYRDIPILNIEPFSRERDTVKETRWLAILHSDILLFGSIVSVRDELDRYLAGSGTDPILARKLARLRHDDQSWCVLSSATRNPGIQNQLVSLDPEMAEAVKNGSAFQFGIRYRKQVEMEYEITPASASVKPRISD